MQECTFKPVINHKSRAMMSDREELLREMRMSAHEQLFQDAIRRQHKMEELSAWVPDDVTFKPHINQDAMAQEYLRRSFDTLSKSPAKTQGAPVVDRLYACYEKTKAKQEAARAKFTGPTDPVTGKPLYRPEVGRAPRGYVRPASAASGSVHEQLYALALESLSRKEAALEAERRQAEAEASAGHSLGTSEKLFRRLKLKRFTQIFDYLLEDSKQQSGGLDLVAMVRRCSSYHNLAFV